MREGGNVALEFRRIVVGPRARGKQAGHERGARGRAQGARAIGAVEHHAALRQADHVRRAGQRMAVDRQERRRHLIGHDDEDIGRFGGHPARNPFFASSLSRRPSRRPRFFGSPRQSRVMEAAALEERRGKSRILDGLRVFSTFSFRFSKPRLCSPRSITMKRAGLAGRDEPAGEHPGPRLQRALNGGRGGG